MSKAPVPFSAEHLARGIQLGERWTFQHTLASGVEWLAHTEVIAWSPEGPTFRFSETELDGSPRGEVREGGLTWEALVSHATYPAGDTEITDATETVPAGMFRGKLYNVLTAPTASVEAFFAIALPGPPVRWAEHDSGRLTHEMVLVERVRG